MSFKKHLGYSSKHRVGSGDTRYLAKIRSSRRWGNVGQPGTTGFTSSRRRTAAKIRSVRASYKTVSGISISGNMQRKLAVGGFTGVRQRLAKSLKSMRRSPSWTPHLTGRTTGGMLKSHRTARQRAQSRINGAKNRGGRRR